LDQRATFGVRRSDLIVKDAPRNVVADGRSRYDRWQLARHDARAMGGVPSIVVKTVHEHEGSQNSEVRSQIERDVTIVNVSGTRDRPGGAAFGVLVHAIVAQVPFDATRAVLDRTALLESRVLGLTEADGRAAAHIVERVLAHDLLARARSAAARGQCRRETPITCQIDDVLVEGVVDLAFEEGGRWTVVDYKTDRELAALGEERYRRQVALYASAIARATGQPATGVL